MVNDAVALHARVDIVIHKGGLGSPTLFTRELGAGHWNELINLDLSGQWWCTMTLLPDLIARRSGRIIFIISSSARRASAGWVSSGHRVGCIRRGKGGLIGLTIGLSAQLGSSGILVNAVAPGSTGTGIPIDINAYQVDINAYQAKYPLGVGEPEPVALACVYLISLVGDWISGAVLNVRRGAWRGY